MKELLLSQLRMSAYGAQMPCIRRQPSDPCVIGRRVTNNAGHTNESFGK